MTTKSIKTIVANSVEELFEKYDELRALGYKRCQHFQEQILAGSPICFWTADMEVSSQEYKTRDQLREMYWEDLKALAARLEVTAKSKEALVHVISKKLGIPNDKQSKQGNSNKK